jgi:hypothetical protein
MYLPLGPMRFRFAPYAPRKLRFAINGYETVALASDLAKRGLHIDWGRTASSGTFVLVAPNKAITVGVGDTAGAVTTASTVVLGIHGQTEEILRHELVHVQQHAFMQEAWGRPAEESLRARGRFVRWLPPWIETGIVPLVVAMADQRAFGRKGALMELMESEARILEQR